MCTSRQATPESLKTTASHDTNSTMTETARARLDSIAKSFSSNRHVTRETRQGFGSGALKAKGKIFAMVSSNGEFVVKLPKARVDELVSAGAGKRFEPGPGRLMKEWLAMSREAKQANWLALSREACQYVGGKG